MKKNNEQAQYWLSSPGQREYREALDAHFRKMRKLAKSTSSQKVSFGSVLILQQFPTDSTFTLVTKGASSILLSAGESLTIRQEFSWAVDSGENIDTCVSVLEAATLAILASGVAATHADVVGTGSRSGKWLAELGDKVSVCDFMAYHGSFLPASVITIKNFFPTYVMELVALTASECKLLKRDAEKFFEMAGSDSDRFFDFRRPERSVNRGKPVPRP